MEVHLQLSFSSIVYIIIFYIIIIFKPTSGSSQNKRVSAFFSTIDHWQTVTQLIIEKFREYQLPLCLAFVDYEKQNAVIQALKKNVF